MHGGRGEEEEKEEEMPRATMHGGRGEEEEKEEVLPRATMHGGRGEEEEKEEEVLPRATMHGGGGGDEDEEDEDEASTPDWILRAADRLAAKIVFERMSTEAVGELASSTGPGSRQRRRQKRATLLRWLRWLAALSFSSLLLILAIGVLRPMAGPAVLSSGIGSQLALFGASDAEACDATGALSTLQAAMQDSSELLRDAMSRGDSAAHAAAKAQVRTPWPHAPWPHAPWPHATSTGGCAAGGGVRGGSGALSVCTGSSPGSDPTPTRRLTRDRRGLRRRSDGGARLRSCCG